MTRRAVRVVEEGPPLRKWLVIAGLTRRLVEAPDVREARAVFVKALEDNGPYAQLNRRLTVEHSDIVIREATADDLQEFAPKQRRAPKMDGQLGLGLPEVPVVQKRRKDPT